MATTKSTTSQYISDLTQLETPQSAHHYPYVPVPASASSIVSTRAVGIDNSGGNKGWDSGSFAALNANTNYAESMYYHRHELDTIEEIPEDILAEELSRIEKLIIPKAAATTTIATATTTTQSDPILDALV